MQGLCRGPGHACYRNLKTQNYDAYMSVAMSALNMVYEATNICIGSCFLSPERDKAKKILRVNKEDDVPLLVGFGFEKKGAYQKQRQRRELIEIVHYEFFCKPCKHRKNGKN